MINKLKHQINNQQNCLSRSPSTASLATIASSGSGRRASPVDNSIEGRLSRVYANKYQVNKEIVSIHSSKVEKIQWNASSESMFFLRKPGLGKYVMEQAGNGSTHIPNGWYNFVIPQDNLTEVICGVPFQQNHVSQRNIPRIVGHTSLSHKGKVLYAGQILFLKGSLLSWNNGSGHYQPGLMSAYPPHIGFILPWEKFKHHNL
jgi:hypothetical protein